MFDGVVDDGGGDGGTESGHGDEGKPGDEGEISPQFWSVEGDTEVMMKKGASKVDKGKGEEEAVANDFEGVERRLAADFDAPDEEGGEGDSIAEG